MPLAGRYNGFVAAVSPAAVPEKARVRIGEAQRIHAERARRTDARAGLG